MGRRLHFICDRSRMDHYFYFEHLQAQRSLAESYALRFQVYCQERGFLPTEDYPEGLESDVFDHRALHFGAYYLEGGLAGTVRLVRGALGDLPLAEKCTITPGAMPADLRTSQLAEISRLAVSRRFRRRETDGLLPDEFVASPAAPDRHRDQRRGFPELVLGLYKIMYQESKRRGIAFWFAAMEPSLARLLRRFNFSFHPIGPEVDYYGPVTPYVARIADLEAEVYAHRPELLREMADGLEEDLMPPQLRAPPTTTLAPKPLDAELLPDPLNAA